MLRKIFCAALVLALHHVELSAQTPSHLQDLRNWKTLGLPMAAEWNTNGYSWQYHVDQVRQGHRFLPSIRIQASSAALNDANLANSVMALTEEGWTYLQSNNVPICLRTQNISGAFVLPLYRLPKVASNIPKSPLVWAIKSGVLEDVPTADPFGPASIWATEGGLWSRSRMLTALQAKHPTPEYLMFLENNEGPYEQVYHCVQVDNTIKNALGYPTLKWLPISTLKTLNLRMTDRVTQLLKANPNANPYDFHPEYWRLRKTQYSSFFSAFEAGLGASWKGKTTKAGYAAMDDARLARPAMFFDTLGYAPELNYFDTGSEPVYSAGQLLTDFTSLDHVGFLNLIPAWEVARARNPKAYRELSLFLSDAGVYLGAQSGWHEVITPKRYEGFVQWLLWSIHEPGVPVILRRFCGSANTPTTPLFRPDQHTILDGLRAGELKTATSETYLKPILSAVDRVCANPTLRNYWLHGTPVIVPGLGHPSKQLSKFAPYPQTGAPDNRWRLLECSTNPPRANWTIVSNKVVDKIKVWAVATRLGDSALIFAWSPCKLTGAMTITVPDLGTFRINVPQPWSYWIVKAGTAPVQVTAP
jgi:hypothetical protein